MAFLPLAVFSQERKQLNGKITSDAEDLEGVYVINRTADVTVATTPGGYFTINAGVSDTLVFSAIQFVAKELIVNERHFTNDLFFVPLEPLVQSLDEAVVTNSTITSESLGIVPKGQKRYTPGESKVYTATQGVDGLINAISGRRKEVKKAAEYEKKELLMEKINYIYTEEDIVNELNIPQEHVKGLIFYAVQDKEFAETLKQKNNAMAKFHMSRIATEYLELIKEEKEDTDEK
jgi:hypothetical protein